MCGYIRVQGRTLVVESMISVWLGCHQDESMSLDSPSAISAFSRSLPCLVQVAALVSSLEKGSDHRRSLERLLTLRSQAVRLCHGRHVILASLHHALLSLISSSRFKGPVDEQLLKDAGIYAAELKATMSIYMPPAHPDLLAVDGMYETILTQRRKMTKTKLARKLPEKALLEVLKVDELSVSAAVSA